MSAASLPSSASDDLSTRLAVDDRYRVKLAIGSARRMLNRVGYTDDEVDGMRDGSGGDGWHVALEDATVAVDHVLRSLKAHGYLTAPEAAPTEAARGVGVTETDDDVLDQDKVLAWPPLKKALWRVVTGEKLNDGHYINAYELTDKLYEAALRTSPPETVGGGGLQWLDDQGFPWGERDHRNSSMQTPFGAGRVHPFGSSGGWHASWAGYYPGQSKSLPFGKIYRTRDEAVAAVEDDYRKRLTAALPSAPPAEETWQATTGRLYEEPCLGWSPYTGTVVVRGTGGWTTITHSRPLPPGPAGEAK